MSDAIMQTHGAKGIRTATQVQQYYLKDSPTWEMSQSDFTSSNYKSHDQVYTGGTILPAATTDMNSCQALLLVHGTVWIGQLIGPAGHAD